MPYYSRKEILKLFVEVYGVSSVTVIQDTGGSITLHCLMTRAQYTQHIEPHMLDENGEIGVQGWKGEIRGIKSANAANDKAFSAFEDGLYYYDILVYKMG